jgi:hypothetical protein
METRQQFEILIRRRIPFFSSFLLSAAFIFFIVLFILYLIMLPSRLSSLEMKTSYFILAIPDVLKRLSVYSIIGLPITVWLYYSLRIYKSAILSFHSKSISIVGKHIDLNIPFRKIKKVYCKGLFKLSARRNTALKVVLQQKLHRSTTFKLKTPKQNEEVLDAFNALEHVEFVFTNDSLAGDTCQD